MDTSQKRQWFAIAAIGRDRPGIVADLSECVFKCGGNLEDASMTMLGSEFATLMLVSGTEPDLATKLADTTKRLEWERSLTIFVRHLDGEPAGETPGAQEHSLKAIGVDRAGIVAGVSRCLADHEVLIDDLRGRVVPIPQSGTPLYELSLRMRVPAGLAVSALEEALALVAESLDVEISVDSHAD